MENVYENVRRELSAENVKEALQLMLQRVYLPENEAKIQAARSEAGDDMVEVMRTVFPIVLAVQIEIVSKFGFAPNHEGLKDFLIRVNQFITEHNDILEILLKIRALYLPGFNQKTCADSGGSVNGGAAAGGGELTRGAAVDATTLIE